MESKYLTVCELAKGKEAILQCFLGLSTGAISFSKLTYLQRTVYSVCNFGGTIMPFLTSTSNISGVFDLGIIMSVVAEDTFIGIGVCNCKCVRCGKVSIGAGVEAMGSGWFFRKHERQHPISLPSL